MEIKDIEFEEEAAERRFSTSALNCVFGKPPREVPQEEVGAQIIGLLIILLSFLQQLSFLVLENLDFGIWGDIFGNINVLSLNIGNPLNNVQGEILYLLAVFNTPTFLMLWYTQANLSWSTSDEEFYKLRMVSWVVFVLFLVAAVVVAILNDFETSLVVAFPSIFILFCKIFTQIRDYYVDGKVSITKEDKVAQDKFFRTEIVFVNYLITFSIPVVASVYITVAVLNVDPTIRVIFGIYGGLLLVFLLIRFYIAEIFDTEFGDKSINVLLYKLTYNFLYIETEMEPIYIDIYRENFGLLSLAILVEKLILASMPLLAADSGNDDITDASEYVVVGILLLGFSIFGFFKPSLETHGNRAETFSRFSNLCIFTFGVANSRLQEREDDLADNFELFSSIFMIIISVYMLFFWLRILNIQVLLPWVYRTVIAIPSTFRAWMTWRKVNSIEEASNIILKRKNQEVSELEWRYLSYVKRVYTVCVERNKPIEDHEEVGARVSRSGKIKMSFRPEVEGIENGALRRHGLSELANFKTLIFDEYANELTDMEIMCENDLLRNINKSGLTGFGISHRRLSLKDANFFMDTLASFDVIESLDFDNLRSTQKEAMRVSTIVTDCTRFTNLMKYSFYNSRTLKNGVKHKILDNLIPCSHHLEYLRFDKCILDDSFLATLYRLILAKEKTEEGCLVETLVIGNNKYSAGAIDKTKKFLKKTKCVKLIDLTQEEFKSSKNDMYEYSAKHHDKYLFQNYKYIAVNADRTHCNVYLADVAEDDSHEDCVANAFVTANGINEYLIQDLKQGNCRGFAHGIVMLSEANRKLFSEELRKKTLPFVKNSDNSKRDLSIPEVIIQTVSSGSHAAYALMILNRELGLDYSELTSSIKAGISLVSLGEKSKNAWIKHLMKKFVEKKKKGERLDVEDVRAGDFDDFADLDLDLDDLSDPDADIKGIKID